MSRAHEPIGDDDGVSLVEVVIAMFLFALLAVAILPLAIQAQALSSTNRDAASASAFASGLLAEVRAEFRDTDLQTCAEVRNFLAARGSAGIVTDPAGSGQTARLTADSTCPAASVSVATIRAKVYSSPAATGTPTATLSTQIVVTGP
ncbi:type IV pilus modification PilV family protein [Microbacterium sp. 1P06AB]|uniref:type IV pilus modification PilV family protein n=1 Tax=Microbacterium sp. 1P06AB TaxID=3132289 RepID=UPI0039A52FC8